MLGFAQSIDSEKGFSLEAEMQWGCQGALQARLGENEHDGVRTLTEVDVREVSAENGEARRRAVTPGDVCTVENDGDGVAGRRDTERGVVSLRARGEGVI